MASATREQKRLLYEQLIGQQLAGKFTITGLLGFGGMGAVYEAVQSPMDRKVALKVIPSYDPTAAARFEREAYTVSKLSHPNTVTVFDFGHTEDGQLFLSMEYLEGRTLTDLIRKEGPLHPARAIHITEQICRSLGEAHRIGIMHRDVKPDNILLIQVDQDPDYVKVLDFGIAKAIQGEDDVNLTAEGRIVGTPRYMSPEQILALHVDHRSDIYSLGCILFEMLCGTPPFDQQSTAALMMSHAQQMPPHFAERLQAEHISLMPPDLERIVHRTMSKSAEARPRDTDELRQELQLALSQMNAGIPFVPQARPQQGPPTAHPMTGNMTGPHAQRGYTPPLEHHTGDFSHQTGNFEHHHHRVPPVVHQSNEEELFERDLQQVKKRSAAPLIIAAILLLGLIAGGVYILTQGDGSENTLQDTPLANTTSETNTKGEALPTTDPATEEAGEAQLRAVQIISDPPGANVNSQGKKVGVTPFTLPLEELTKATSFRIELDGYKAELAYVDPENPKETYTYALSKEPQKSTPSKKKSRRGSSKQNSRTSSKKSEPEKTPAIENKEPVKDVTPNVKKLDDTQDTSPNVKRLD